MLCIPVQEKTLKKTIQQVKIASKKADLVEIWLDRVGDLNEKSLQNNLKKLVKFSKKPLLAVCKARSEKGNWTQSEEKRVEILKNAASCGFQYVDIGIDTAKNLIKELIKNKKKAKIIISYHNFEKTPDLRELEKIHLQAANLGADIVKIATAVNKTEDNLRILNLLNSRNGAKKPSLIAIGMGEKGKITRIFGPQLGSPITYISLSKKTFTAPGQLTLKQYRQIHKILF